MSIATCASSDTRTGFFICLFTRVYVSRETYMQQYDMLYITIAGTYNMLQAFLYASRLRSYELAARTIQ